MALAGREMAGGFFGVGSPGCCASSFMPSSPLPSSSSLLLPHLALRSFSLFSSCFFLVSSSSFFFRFFSLSLASSCICFSRILALLAAIASFFFFASSSSAIMSTTPRGAVEETVLAALLRTAVTALPTPRSGLSRCESFLADAVPAPSSWLPSCFILIGDEMFVFTASLSCVSFLSAFSLIRRLRSSSFLSLASLASFSDCSLAFISAICFLYLSLCSLRSCTMRSYFRFSTTARSSSVSSLLASLVIFLVSLSLVVAEKPTPFSCCFLRIMAFFTRICFFLSLRRSRSALACSSFSL
mmetsp:Transcript_1076/g.2396  ORF Transcript_1076/g.2396 Transcript_1076/m.2396 type:complete len:299 (-) Transcript_1076:1153-2049(-)